MANRRGAIAFGALFSLAAAPVRAAPEIAIVGATPDGFRFRVSGAAFSHTFRVMAKNAEAAAPTAAFVPPFENAAGVPVTTQATWPTDAKLSLTGPTDLVLSATLPELGDYTTELVLTMANTRMAAHVAVTRALDEPGLETLGSTTAMLTAGFCESSADLPLLLRDIGDQQRKLEIPTSVVLDRQTPGNLLLQTGAKLNGVYQADKVAPKQFELPRGETAMVTLRFDGLEQSGRYQGTVRIVSADHKPLDVAVALLVKRPWWAACLCTALGVGASAWLRWYLMKGRNVLVWQRDLARLRERLVELAGQPLGQREQAVLDSCNTMLATLAARIGDGRSMLASVADPSASIHALSAKLDALVYLTQGYLRVAALPAAAQSPLLDALDESAAQLAKANEPTDISAVVTNLNGLKFSQAQRVALTDAIAQTESLLQASVDLTAMAGSSKVDELWFILLEVKASVSTGSQLDRAQEELTGLRGQLIQLLATALLKEIQGAEPPPITAARWQGLQQRIAPELQAIIAQTSSAPELAANEFSKLLNRYADELVAALNEVGAIIDQQIDGSAHVPDPPAAHQRVKATLAHLEATRSSSLSGRLDAIRQAQRELGTLLELSAPPSYTPTSAGVSSAVALVRAWVAPEPERARARAADEAEVPHLRRALRTNDRWVTLALFVVALLSGLDVLWMNDPIWGGPSAYLIATLWGLGLHSVGNVTFDGLLNLRDKFSKAS